MVYEMAFQTLLSAVSGLVVAVTTAALTTYRQRRRWLRTKVYQPMYGELTEAISGDLPEHDDAYQSRWADLEYYKTYRVDAPLAEALDRYSSHLSELAGIERDDDYRTFVEALPDRICPGNEGAVELQSGRRIDLRVWLGRNALVLSTTPTIRRKAFGLEPAELSFLWDEVDGIDPAGDGDFDTAEALTVVSREFNWGYEPLYEEWDDGWLDALADAYVEAATAEGSTVQRTLLARRRIGETANEIKTMVERRADRGLLVSLARRVHDDGVV